MQTCSPTFLFRLVWSTLSPLLSATAFTLAGGVMRGGVTTDGVWTGWDWPGVKEGLVAERELFFGEAMLSSAELSPCKKNCDMSDLQLAPGETLQASSRTGARRKSWVLQWLHTQSPADYSNQNAQQMQNQKLTISPAQQCSLSPAN